MRVTAYIEEPVSSLLDVGCNIGSWLQDCAGRYPGARLAGVEINEPSLEKARASLPTAELHHAGAESLPFPDRTFQYVTCMEVLEHIPPDLRAAAFREMRRVLRPGGRLVLTVPHAGWFAWMDSNNMRFRLPILYRRLVGRGHRDANYAAAGRQVEWHHHFVVDELRQLAGEGWREVGVGHGGLLLFPAIDWLSWPFYRLGMHEHPVRRVLGRAADWDYARDYGRASYGLLIALERADPDGTPTAAGYGLP